MIRWANFYLCCERGNVMTNLFEKVRHYSMEYEKLKNDREFADKAAMPGKSYFLENDDILAIPRNDGDCRYPYGSDGFNFWTYASGYMHCNEGIFSPFLRAAEGQEPKIAFFAAVPNGEGETETISLLSVPVLNTGVKTEQYTIFTKCCAYYMTELKSLRFAIRTFVDDAKRIVFTVTAENLGDHAQDIVLSSFFNPFLVHDIVENAEHRWFREVRYIPAADEKELGCFLIKTNEDLSRTVSVSNYAVIKRKFQCGKESRIINHEATASRYQYVGGSRGSLHSPAAVRNKTFHGAKHVCAFTEVGAAGDLISLAIGAGDTIRLDIVFDYAIYCMNEARLNQMINSDVLPEEIDRLLLEKERKEREINAGLKLQVAGGTRYELKERVFNSFMEHLKKQVEFCSLIKGYVQLAYTSLIGIRDVFQALEGLLIWQPEAARQKMLEALEFIAPNGRCPRQYSLPSREGAVPAMDLRAFIDQGVWVISTIATYLKYTGDFAFLEEQCGYYEIIDEKNKLVKSSDIRDSVLEHMLKTMNYLIENRDLEKTKCVRALYGDWNDALDGLGVSMDPDKEFGTGVSVMASLQVYQNLSEMEELLQRLDSVKYASLIDQYRQVRKEIKEGLEKYAVITGENGEKRIVHGWGDQLSYYVGSFDDPDHQSRHGLTSNAFWVLSGLYGEDVSIKNTILHAFSQLDSKYGLKTFAPHFEPNTKGVGRIPKLPAGTAENGASYVHASLFGVMAMFRMGCPEMAWEQMVKSLPFTHEYVSCSPYIMPNSYGLNEEKGIDGQSMADWQTGSSNVLLKTLVRYVYGIQPEYDGVWIQPASYCPFERLDLDMNIRNCKIHLTYSNEHSGSRKFIVNGEQRRGAFDSVMQLDRLWIGNDELKSGRLCIQIID